MLFESVNFNTGFEKPAAWSGHVFRYCEFSNIGVEDGDVDSVFIDCRIENCEWYWGLFVCAVFVNVRFKGCVFRGTGFSGSRFVDCKFSDCKFVKDNLGADCSFDDISWHGCVQHDCVGLEREFRSRR